MQSPGHTIEGIMFSPNHVEIVARNWLISHKLFSHLQDIKSWTPNTVASFHFEILFSQRARVLDTCGSSLQAKGDNNCSKGG